jgi:hypothetical protein
MLWRPDEHEPLTEQEWDPDIARDAIAEIVADAEAAAEDGVWPTHPLDEVPVQERFCSLYLGGAGMIWGCTGWVRTWISQPRSRRPSTATAQPRQAKRARTLRACCSARPESSRWRRSSAHQ